MFRNLINALSDQYPSTVTSTTRSTSASYWGSAKLLTRTAFDWNCPQHITQRFTVAELEPHLAPLRDQLAALQAENAELREKLNLSG